MTADLTIGRQYEIIAVYERRNVPPVVTVVCPGPFTHAEACAVKGKFNPHKNVRIQLRELP